MGARTLICALGLMLILAWGRASCDADEARTDGANSSAAGSSDQADDPRPYGLESRTPWSTSRVVGAPEPPPPYVAVKQFNHIAWERPLTITAEPGTNWLIVIQQGGEDDRPSKLL
ncbi:MAG: hypothetical protein KDA72_22795, partial [Planctomycetales bacterium]|nr:hypothetical protein [Planctomycetales bacterium]